MKVCRIVVGHRCLAGFVETNYTIVDILLSRFVVFGSEIVIAVFCNFASGAEELLFGIGGLVLRITLFAHINNTIGIKFGKVPFLTFTGSSGLDGIESAIDGRKVRECNKLRIVGHTSTANLHIKL